MKISEPPGRLVIDNPPATQSVCAIVLALGSLTTVLIGLLNHIKWLYVLALAVLMIGALVAFFAKPTHIVLSSSNASSVSSRWLFLSMHSQTFSLTDAVSVLLVSSRSQNRASSSAARPAVNMHTASQVSATIYLLLGDGSRLALGSQTRCVNIESSDGTPIRSMPLKKEAERIAAFVGVPLQAHDALTIANVRTA